MTGQEIVQALRCCADHSCSAKCPAFPAGLDCRSIARIAGRAGGRRLRHEMQSI